MSDATPPAEMSAKPRRRFRRLRFAVSVFFAVLTVVLCVLWVRSYWWFDKYTYGTIGNCGPMFASSQGYVTVRLRQSARSTFSADLVGLVGLESYSNGIFIPDVQNNPLSTDTIRTYFSAGYNGFVAPHWAITLAFAVVAAATWANYLVPRVSQRFSLHTLFIATTLVAIVLGLVCCALR